MEKCAFTGGATIDFLRISWPFASLKVDKNRLELNASIIGKLVFQPADIISIEVYDNPIRSKLRGLIITHKISNYSKKVVFFSFKNPHIILNQIKEVGFLDEENASIDHSDEAILEQQKAGSYPFKLKVVIPVIIVLSLFFFFDFYQFIIKNTTIQPIRFGSIIAVGTLLLLSILVLVSRKISGIFMKEGKSVNDIKTFIYFMICILSVSFITLTIGTIYLFK